MYKVYILKSTQKNKYYIGHTEDLEKRLRRHNNGLVQSTKNARPWLVVYSEEYGNKSDAYRREFKIKSFKGGEAFKKLID